MAPLKVLIMAVSTLSRAVRVLSPRAWQITLRTETVTVLTSMPLHVKKLVDKVFKRSRKRDDAGSETSDSSTLYLPVHNSPLNETIVALRRGNDALIHHPELKQSVSGLLLLTENIDDKVDPNVLEKLGGELKQLLGILQAPELSNTPSVQGYARNLASHIDAAVQQARSRISGSSTGQSNGQLRDVAAITALADSLHSAIEKYRGQITTQDSTATSSTTKKKARDFSGQVAGALTIVKESLDGVPVIGLKAAIGGLLEILKAVNQLIDNDDDLMKLIDHLQRLVKIVSLPPEDDAQLIDSSTRERINELTEDILHITAEAEKLKTQNTGGKFFGSADNASAIEGLMRAVDQATERFQIAGGLRLEKGVARVEKGVQELQVGSGRIESGIGRLEGGVGSVGEGVGRVEGGIGMVKEGVQRVDKKIEQLEANIMSAADEAMLNNIQPRSDNARYNSASQTSASFCLPDTRVAILTEISRWLENPEALPVYWLYGMAGTGKSTIARTVAKYSDERGSYGASFFFSRDEDDRRNATRVFPTLAHQLACYNPSFRPHITAAIRINPGASTAMMRTQLDKLIVEPLQLSPPYSSPVLIVLDALDECASELHIVEMLNLLAPAIQAIRKTSNVKFFITCRPEVHIHSVLTKPEMQAVADVSVLHDIEKSVVQEDIRLFVEHHLTRIAENMLPKGTTWPPEDEKDALVEMSDVLFIFASVSIAYIGDPKFRQPKLRLRNLVSSWVRELGSPPLKRLDLLYRQILTAALPEDDEEEREEVAQRIHQILGVIVLLQNPLSVRSLDLLLQKESDTVASTIGPFNSVLSIPLDDQRPVLSEAGRSGITWIRSCIMVILPKFASPT
ncbi:hypothetical protein FRC02_005617 [Tulasnella sp. 418]|nr:hypothetical protein FRC02_005617 [Tulasnella sp. 418]